jgi:hypothetical protein
MTISLVSCALFFVQESTLARRSYLALFGVLLVCGCGGVEPAGNAVSGTVTFQGKPLDFGSIQFDPTGDQGTMSGGDIEGGEYSVPAATGLKPGTYAVRISSVEGGVSSSDVPPGEPPPPAKERIPAKFNAQTTLKADIKEGDNSINFDIP